MILSVEDLLLAVETVEDAGHKDGRKLDSVHELKAYLEEKKEGHLEITTKKVQRSS